MTLYFIVLSSLSLTLLFAVVWIIKERRLRFALQELVNRLLSRRSSDES